MIPWELAIIQRYQESLLKPFQALVNDLGGLMLTIDPYLIIIPAVNKIIRKKKIDGNDRICRLICRNVSNGISMQILMQLIVMTWYQTIDLVFPVHFLSFIHIDLANI